MLLCDHDGVRVCTDQGWGEEAFIQRDDVTRDVTESVTDTGLRSGSDELLTDDHCPMADGHWSHAAMVVSPGGEVTHQTQAVTTRHTCHHVTTRTGGHLNIYTAVRGVRGNV